MKSSNGEDSQKPMSTEESDRALALQLQKQLDLEANQSLEADPDASQAQGRSTSSPAGTDQNAKKIPCKKNLQLPLR